MLTIITPTGDRRECFRLCEHWIRQQTYAGPLQWIVVDDGKRPTKCSMGQEYVRREPRKNDPRHTLAANLRLAWPRVNGNKILIIEDDDYYAPRYLAEMDRLLGSADLVGEVGARYYFVKTRQYRVFSEHKHASLCRTGFTRKVLPLLRKLTKTDASDIDMRLWSAWNGEAYQIPNQSSQDVMTVSLKGMPGRSGVTHTPKVSWSLLSDDRLSALKTWIGDDWKYYVPFLGQQDDSLVVYTCVFGGYDRLKRQPEFDCVRYVAVTDGNCKPQRPWEIRVVDSRFKSPRRSSRHPKILSHEYFPGQSTLYIDATMTMQRDPREFARHLTGGRCVHVGLSHHPKRRGIEDEAKAIMKVRFDDPDIVRKHLERYDELDTSEIGLPAGGMIFRRPGAELFERTWWDEYSAGSMRDQMSLPYALVKSGVVYNIAGLPCPWETDPPWLTRSNHTYGRTSLEPGMQSVRFAARRRHATSK